jgi:hypothetical protein
MKLLTYSIIFLVVTACLMVSLGTVIVAVSNVGTNLTLHCHVTLKTYNHSIHGVSQTSEVVCVPGDFISHTNSMNLFNEEPIGDSRSLTYWSSTNDSYNATINFTTTPTTTTTEAPELVGVVTYETQSKFCDEETISNQWTWCLFLCLVTVDFLTFLRCIWYICFRREEGPSWTGVIAVSTKVILIL